MRYAGAVVSGIDAKRITLLAACAIMALAAWPITRLSDGMRAQYVRWGYRPSPFLLRFLVASACWGAALGAFNPFTNVFFAHYLGVATAHLGNFFSIAQLIQAGAVLLAPIVLRRTGLTAGIMLAQLATAAALGLLALGRGLLQVEVIYCGFMAAQHMSEPAIQSLLMDRMAAEERSGAAAMNLLALSIAQAVAAMIAGAAFARFGYPPVLAGIAVAAAGSALLFRMLCASPN